ncbi:MAG: RNA polymerase sigma factor [Acidimicrobiales bacterium]
MAADTPSDETLLASMALGDEHAALSLVRRYQRRVYGLALSVIGDPGLAEDVSQEAFVRVWRHAPVYDTRRGSVAAWVLTITRNLAIDALRMRRASPTDPEEFVNLGLVSRDGDPDRAALDSEAAERLQAAIVTLPVEQRRAVVLAAFYGLTAKEVGVRESIPLGTAKTRIRNGLLRLRAVLVADEASS